MSITFNLDKFKSEERTADPDWTRAAEKDFQKQAESDSRVCVVAGIKVEKIPTNSDTNDGSRCQY